MQCPLGVQITVLCYSTLLLTGGACYGIGSATSSPSPLQEDKRTLQDLRIAGVVFLALTTSSIIKSGFCYGTGLSMRRVGNITAPVWAVWTFLLFIVIEFCIGTTLFSYSEVTNLEYLAASITLMSAAGISAFLAMIIMKYGNCHGPQRISDLHEAERSAIEITPTGNNPSNAAELFAVIVFLCDEYLSIPESSTPSAFTPMQEVRFFQMARALPMELQMKLANLVYSLPQETILSGQSEPVFQRLGRSMSTIRSINSCSIMAPNDQNINSS